MGGFLPHTQTPSHEATTSSFDVTTGADLQEVDNALNQASTEIAQRYHFKGSESSAEFKKAESIILLVTDSEMRMNALLEIVQAKLKTVQAAIQGEQVRASAPSKDDLQEAIALLRSKDFGVELQFGNYR